MKKLLVLVFALIFIAGIVHAADLAGIGYIDVQKVFTEFKETTKAQKDLEKQEEDFKKEFEKSQEKLKKAEEEGKTPEELQKMQKDLEKSLMPKRESLIRMNQQLTAKLQQEILESVKTVGKKVGIDIVLDKQVVITGGMDLTELVITNLNK